MCIRPVRLIISEFMLGMRQWKIFFDQTVGLDLRLACNVDGDRNIDHISDKGITYSDVELKGNIIFSHRSRRCTLYGITQGADNESLRHWMCGICLHIYNCVFIKVGIRTVPLIISQNKDIFSALHDIKRGTGKCNGVLLFLDWGITAKCPCDLNLFMII